MACSGANNTAGSRPAERANASAFFTRRQWSAGTSPKYCGNENECKRSGCHCTSFFLTRLTVNGEFYQRGFAPSRIVGHMRDHLVFVCKSKGAANGIVGGATLLTSWTL